MRATFSDASACLVRRRHAAPLGLGIGGDVACYKHAAPLALS
jgi:hypothetical protein